MRRIIASLTDDPPPVVALAVADVLEQHVARLWQHGWQPADLHRVVTRHLGSREAVLARWVMAQQATQYADLGARVAPRWMAQLDEVEATRDWDQRRPYLLQLGGQWSDVIGVAVRLSGLLGGLPVLPRLVDPPDAWDRQAEGPRGSLPANVLAKVRALLAKAEATTFEAEAEAFTAKAQELMARHRIDRALLASSDRAAEEEPGGRRIGIEDPYAEAKVLLLHSIAEANGCRAVWSKDLGFATAFGFDDELDAVDELFTSLLVQATAALQREGPRRDHSGRSRTTRFRRSFLVAFAVRIGHRLQATVDATVAAADTSHALVPILAAREDATRAAAEATFPELSSVAPTASDREGWYAGTTFADRADLSFGAPSEEAAPDDRLRAGDRA
ncbi:MAG TPA: DUF2786 domain-containing protein [Nitriliruptorales bacterium]